MNKILPALSILSAGAGTFLFARQSTTQLQQKANETREVWLVQTQLVAVAQDDQAGLSKRVRELKQVLAQPQAVRESAVWSAFQTNGVGHLTPELRDSLREELGFNWQSSPDYIVVSKEAVREIQMVAITRRDGKLTDVAATVLAMTPGERGQVEAAMQRVQTDFNEWALAHVERSEPKDDVVAQYTLPGDPAMLQSMSNNFAGGVFDAPGRERAELILPSAVHWMRSIGIYGTKPATMTVKRYLAGNQQRLKVQLQGRDGATQSQDLWLGPLWELGFPKVFRPIFPDGWAGVAQREGFELPEKPQKK